MYKPIIITRHIRNGNVIGFVVKYNPPCPPIQVYIVKEKGLDRILPNGEIVKWRVGGLEESLMVEDLNTLEVKYPHIHVEDIKRKFKPEDYLTNPRGEYDIL